MTWGSKREGDTMVERFTLAVFFTTVLVMSAPGVTPTALAAMLSPVDTEDSPNSHHTPRN
jgi:hypothetical protein